MPGKYTPLVVLLFLGVAIFAFWPSYFAVAAEASFAVHFHVATAIAWFVMVIVQSWLALQRKLPLHRLAGKLSFLLFPLFIGGSMLVIHAIGRRIATRNEPFLNDMGARLEIYDLTATLAFAFLFYQALRNRRSIALHAGYMLATLLLLIGPVSARMLSDFFPYFDPQGPEELYRYALERHVANAFSILLALVLYLRSRPYGAPFAAAAAALVLQSTLFETVGRLHGWEQIVLWYAALPSLLVMAVSVLIGGLLVQQAWLASRPDKPQPKKEAAVAN